MSSPSIGGVKVEIRGDWSLLKADFADAQAAAKSAGDKLASSFGQGASGARQMLLPFTSALADANNKIRGVGDQLSLFGGQAAQAASAADKLAAAESRVAAEARAAQAAIDAQGTNLAQKLQTIDKAAQGLEQSMSGFSALGGRMQTVGLALTAGITTPIVGAGVAAVVTAGKFEQAEVAFAGLLGSAQKAGTFLQELKDFASKTPFEFPELVTASKRMLALGFEAQQVMPMLRTIGDTAAGLGAGAEGVNRITLALGQMSAKGKVSAQEMNQLAEMGVKAWEILAKSIGVSIPQAMKMAEAGAISSATAIPAILAGMNEKFAGQMDAQSKTLLGQWSNFKDQVTFILMDIGKTLMPTLKSIFAAVMPLLNVVRSLVEVFAALPAPVQTVAVGLVALVAALGPVVLAIGSMLVIVPLLTTNLSAMSAAAITTTGTMPPLAAVTATTNAALVGINATLTVTNALIMGLAKAVPFAIAAFAGWKLGEWAESNFPAVARLMEKLRELLNIGTETRAAREQLIHDIERIQKALTTAGVGFMAGNATDKYLDYLTDLASKHNVWRVAVEGVVTANAQLSSAAKKLMEEQGAANKAVVDARKVYDELVAAKRKGLATDNDVARAAVELEKAQDAVTVSTRAATDAAKKSADELKRASEEYAKHKRHLVENSEKSLLLRAEADRLTQSFAEARKKLVELRASLEKTPQDARDLAAGLEDLVRESDKTLKSVGKLPKAIYEMDDATKRSLKGVQDVMDAYHEMGLKTPAELQKVVNENKKAWETIVKDSGAQSVNALEAWIKLETSKQDVIRRSGQEITSEQKRGLDKAQEQLDKALGKQTSSWETFSKQISTIITDMGKSITDRLFKAFSGDFNKNLDAEAAKLKESLQGRTSDWEKYQADVAEKLASLREANAESLAKEEGDLAAALDKERSHYEEYVADVDVKLGALREKSAQSLDKELFDLADRLRDKEASYEEYARSVGEKEQDIRRTHAEQLAGQLDDLRENLRDKQESYEDFVSDANRSLARIGADLAEDIRDQTRSTNRRIEDENEDFARDTIKLNEDILDAKADDARDIQKINDDILKAEAKGDKEQVRLLKRSLAQRESNRASILQRSLAQLESDHNKTLRRLREDQEEQVRDARRQAEQQTADAKLNLERRARDHAEFIAENTARQAEVTRNHADQQTQQLTDLQTSLRDRTDALIAFRTETDTLMRDARDVKAGELVTAERDLADSLAARTTEWETYKRDASDKLIEIQGAHSISLGKQEADLLRVLNDKRTDYDLYVTDIELKLAALVEAHKTAWDNIRDVMTGALGDMGQAIMRFGTEFLINGLFKWLKNDLLDDILPKVASALGSIFGGVGGVGSGPGGVPGLGAASGQIADVISGGVNAGGSVVGTAGDVFGDMGGVTRGVGGGAGSAASGALGTVSAVTGIITGAVSAISGVIGNFQFAHMNTALGRIEESTRYAKDYLLQLVERGINLFLAELPVIRGLQVDFLEQHAWRIHDVWERLGEIKDALSNGTNGTLWEISQTLIALKDGLTAPSLSGPSLAGFGGGGNRSITININGQISNKSDVDYMVEQISRNLR